jgi:hypothetical protein
LGFYNNENEWKCVDECLEVSEGQLCGETDHFTSFAILLGGNGNNDKCNSDSQIVIQYLTWIFLGTSIIIVCASWILIELKTRYSTHQKKISFQRLSDRIGTMSNGASTV